MPSLNAVNGPERRHVWISGRVQGVWFRESCRAKAVELGVTGWVRNLGDGRVEAVFEGPDGALDQIVSWCHDGPRSASVVVVEVAVEPVVGEAGFSVR
jgi:acylphosphatase